MFGPNITGQVGSVVSYLSYAINSGAFYKSESSFLFQVSSGSGIQANNVSFDAYNSNALHSTSNTIQPPSNQVLIIIKT